MIEKAVILSTGDELITGRGLKLRESSNRTFSKLRPPERAERRERRQTRRDFVQRGRPDHEERGAVNAQVHPEQCQQD